jgi:predicted Zn-dependent peptidase
MFIIILKRNILVTITLLFLTFLPLHSGQIEDSPFPITHFQLKNGLNVILAEDHSFPVVSVAVAYHVGSFHESEGKSGLAHLLETLMFQGSRNVGRMQHINFINRTGGRFDALTTVDKTIFHQTVPANQLELVLWLESDRMFSLRITREKVEKAKQSLIDGIRFRKLDDPYMSSSLYFTQLLFGDYSYNHPVMGFETDLSSLSLQDVRSFYSNYYRPNNSVICIAGHIDKVRTRELVEKYFQSIPAGPKLEETTKTEFHNILEDIHFSEKSLTSSPRLYIGYRVASPYSDDYFPMDICSYILVKGTTSRLYKRLVIKDRIATSLGGGIEIRKDRAVFKIFIALNSEVNRARCQRVVFSEINKFISSLISSKELEKAKIMLKSNYLSKFATVSGRAVFLANRFLERNHPEQVYPELNQFLSVTSHRVMIIANKYFSKHKVILDVKIR